MTQEEQDLLLKVLCAMLPYGVMCKWYGDGVTGVGKLDSVCKIKTSAGFEYWDCYFEDDGDDIPIEIVKPYLRPMSSMTEEEESKYNLIQGLQHWTVEDGKIQNYGDAIDWLNAHHFDYRGLIEMGLALEAPEGMYNF